ncbi:hypothetical protein SLE2022_326210 [Rubroshorea leprosula]
MPCNLRVCINLQLYFPIRTCFRYLFPGLSSLITTTTASLLCPCKSSFRRQDLRSRSIRRQVAALLLKKSRQFTARSTSWQNSAAAGELPRKDFAELPERSSWIYNSGRFFREILCNWGGC